MQVDRAQMRWRKFWMKHPKWLRWNSKFIKKMCRKTTKKIGQIRMLFIVISINKNILFSLITSLDRELRKNAPNKEMPNVSSCLSQIQLLPNMIYININACGWYQYICIYIPKIQPLPHTNSIKDDVIATKL